ncbi:MAG TPA: hypothetical protein VFG49_09635 [Dyella sp.]|uniref:hypothetical protein n=1 Tax=Dyella sp. TaxID=1869338 RepID=UPI002D793D7D|nr:hypothetical protein [Dyella sp.]HET6553786.1 hypothetical protein [Dyella sp.]
MITASNKTAALAGALSALAFASLEAWEEKHKAASVLAHNVIWLCVACAFFFVPVYFLVIGRRERPFKRLWFNDSAERARYGIVAKRFIAWFLGAVTSAALWTLILVAMQQSV